MTDNSTDKLILVAIVMVILLAAILTNEPKAWDAFALSLPIALTALAMRIRPHA